MKHISTVAGNEAIFNRILLIEDDSSHVLLIKRALNGLSAEISEASCSAEALKCLERPEQFDLVISDLNLPDKPALVHIADLCRLAPELPLVVLTSSNSLAEAVEAMRLGAKDYLVKDFDSNFREVLRFALMRQKTLLENERERQRMQSEMQVLRVAIENSDDAMAVTGLDGRVQYSNQAFRQLIKRCGGSPESVPTFFSSSVAKHEALAQELSVRLTQLAPGAVWNTEVLFKDGSQTAFALNVSAIGGEGSAARFVLWARDISEQKRREKFQREILSTTTHDLKGPLGAIIISSELLTESLGGSGRPEELALRISSSARSAVNLIDEFLSARRIQEGAFILKPVQLRVSALIEEVLADYQTIAAARGIRLASGMLNTELEWKLDKLGFSRVLGNLLSNALKFTPRGGEVSLNLSSADAELLVEVRDTGSGMEPGEVQKIFERFSRLEKHADTAGTGLGLFVVKSVVNAHGGRVEVSSQSGVGTSFLLRFPAEPPVNDRGELICLEFA